MPIPPMPAAFAAFAAFWYLVSAITAQSLSPWQVPLFIHSPISFPVAFGAEVVRCGFVPRWAGLMEHNVAHLSQHSPLVQC